MAPACVLIALAVGCSRDETTGVDAATPPPRASPSAQRDPALAALEASLAPKTGPASDDTGETDETEALLRGVAAELEAASDQRRLITPGDAPQAAIRLTRRRGVDEFVGFRERTSRTRGDEVLSERSPSYTVNQVQVESLSKGAAKAFTRRRMSYPELPVPDDRPLLVGDFTTLDGQVHRFELGPLGELQPVAPMLLIFNQMFMDIGFTNHLVLEIPAEPVGVGARWEIVGLRREFPTSYKYRTRVELLARADDKLRVRIEVDEVPSPQSQGSLTIARGRGELEYRLDRVQPVGGTFHIEVDHLGEPHSELPGRYHDTCDVEFEALDADAVATHRARALERDAQLVAALKTERAAAAMDAAAR